MNLFPERSPSIQITRQAESFNGFYSSIGRNPCHDLGMRKLTSWTPNFPDTFVGFLPIGFEEVHNGALDAPCIFVAGQPGPARNIKGIHYFAIHIKLVLCMRCIAHANWLRVFVTG